MDSGPIPERYCSGLVQTMELSFGTMLILGQYMHNNGKNKYRAIAITVVLH
ncbi:MAG: hypothetical protein GX754_01795 [Clostridiaceae bacterium]|nr:hypothetical protein [Clostridiaceae bacterium]